MGLEPIFKCHCKKPSRHSSVFRASVWSHFVRQQKDDRSQFQASSMPAHSYMATNRLVGVTPKVVEKKDRECVAHMPLPSTNKAAHSGFETQRRHRQKSKKRVSVPHKKDLCPSKIFKNRKKCHCKCHSV